MAQITANGDMPPAPRQRAREGIEHLQAAARELIEAARAALDVAEELVDDPESVASLAGALVAMGDVAKRVTGTGGWPSSRAPRPATGDVPTAEARVERITVV
jgi:hypothetical protein